MQSYNDLKSKKHVGVSHNDGDGHGCKFLLRKAFGEKASIQTVPNHEVTQAVRTILEKKKYKDAVMWITDVSFDEEQEEEMFALIEEERKNGRIIIMFDHHKSALHYNVFEWAEVMIRLEDGTKTCATSLLYAYLIKENLLQSNAFLDSFVEYVRLYDVWEWEKEKTPEAKWLNDLFYLIGIGKFDKKMHDKCNQNPNMPLSFNEIEKVLIELEQKKIHKYIEARKRKTVQIQFEGLHLGVVFAESYASELGNELAKTFPHLDAIAIVNMITRKVSLRSNKDHIDVSQVATKWGGGGHEASAGFDLCEKTYANFVKDVFFKAPIQLDPENKFNNRLNEETYYIRDSGTIAYIRKEHTQYIVHSPCGLLTFLNLEEAENFLKREYEMILMSDIDYIQVVSEKMNIKPAHLQSQFHKIMK